MKVDKIGIRMEVLITEREGMVAENTRRAQQGEIV